MAVGATLVVALLPANAKDGSLVYRGAPQTGRPQGSPLQRAILEDFCHAHHAALPFGNGRLSYLHNDSYVHIVARCSTRASATCRVRLPAAWSGSASGGAC